jgi:hypothetical protein
LQVKHYFQDDKAIIWFDPYPVRLQLAGLHPFPFCHGFRDRIVAGKIVRPFFAAIR